MSLPTIPAPVLIHMLYGVDLVTKTEVATAALFMWDYFITLGMEIELIWPSQWNIIKVLFLVQRYMPFIDTLILTLYRDLLPNQLGSDCAKLQNAQGFLYITGFAISEVLLTFRVWAVWSRDKSMSLVLFLAFILVWTPCYVFMHYFARSIEFLPRPPYQDATGCFVIHANNLVVWCWTCLMIWNALTLVLMLIQGVRSYQAGANSTLMTIVYRDGTFYYIYLFALSALNIIFAVAVTPTKRFVLTALERCLHTILASRVILHMRDHARNRELQFTEDMTGDRVEFNVSAIRDDIDAVLGKGSTPRVLYRMREFD